MRSINKCHVVYVINGIRKSGPNEVLLNMVKGINKDKYRVTVVSFLNEINYGQEQLLINAGANHINIGVGAKRKIITKGARLLSDLFSIIKPDIIHSHAILSDIAVARSSYDAPRFSTVHNDMRADNIYLFGVILGQLYSLWHKLYLRKMTRVINCSKTAYEANKDLLPSSTYVRNGVDNTVISKRAAQKIRTELGYKSDDILYVFAGSLTHRKNVIGLINSFNSSRHKDEYLLIMGEGELEDECKKAAGDSVRLLGFREDAQLVLSAADVYVSFSCSEGFSISVIEALEKGLYLLLSDIPSHREVFEIEPNRYIGEYFTDDTFAKQKNKLRCNRFKRHNIVRFKKAHLSAVAMMHGYEAIYDSAARK